MIAKPNYRVKRACTFCGSNGHGGNVKNCKKGNIYRGFQRNLLLEKMVISWKISYKKLNLITSLVLSQQFLLIFIQNWVRQEGNKYFYTRYGDLFLHSLLCARNGATRVSFLYDGTNIEQNENHISLIENEYSQSTILNCETQYQPNTMITPIHNNVAHIPPNSFIQNNGMMQSNTSNSLFPNMDFSG